MKHIKAYCCSFLLLLLSINLFAQEYNAVPLDNIAYDIIALGVLRGVILPPPAAKPWSARTIKQKLLEMLGDPSQLLTADEEETVVSALESFDRSLGFVINDGRFRAENKNAGFELGFAWESDFSVGTPGKSMSSVNLAKLYTAGDALDFLSWNINAAGEFLYIDRDEQGNTPAIFPYTFSRPWDGGVLSLRNPDALNFWPDDPTLAYELEGELNAIFFDRLLELRIGRIRHDWGQGLNETSLFLNTHSRPFLALEGNFLPTQWLNIAFLAGALEHAKEDNCRTNVGQFANILTTAQIEFNPLIYVHFSIGAAAVLLNQPNGAFFTDLEFRLPGMFSLWGRLFVDRLDGSSGGSGFIAGNSIAYQGGIKTVVYWLPLSSFTLSYTKIEPYCYSGEWNSRWTAFANSGESLGYYLPPNSDEFLVRLESMFRPEIRAHVQFQMIRHGADFGYGAVPGSSLYEKMGNARAVKHFLKDGVYQWDNVIKLGAALNLRTRGIPLLFHAETGLVMTSFTINSNAGIGNEAPHEPLSDQVYQPVNCFIFSIGFRLFP